MRKRKYTEIRREKGLSLQLLQPPGSPLPPGKAAQGESARRSLCRRAAAGAGGEGGGAGAARALPGAGRAASAAAAAAAAGASGGSGSALREVSRDCARAAAPPRAGGRGGRGGRRKRSRAAVPAGAGAAGSGASAASGVAPSLSGQGSLGTGRGRGASSLGAGGGCRALPGGGTGTEPRIPAPHLPCPRTAPGSRARPDPAPGALLSERLTRKGTGSAAEPPRLCPAHLPRTHRSRFGFRSREGKKEEKIKRQDEERLWGSVDASLKRAASHRSTDCSYRRKMRNPCYSNSAHTSATCLDRKAWKEGGEASAQARLPTGEDPWEKTYNSSRGEAQI